MKKLGVSLLFLTLSFAYGFSQSSIGQWVTIDDKSGKEIYC